jgi:hypothetical protein
VSVLAGAGFPGWSGVVAALVILANVVLHFIEHRLAPPGGDG